MPVFETIVINTCRDCRHVDHTGGFTKGGSKPCCNHPDIVTLKGNDCFKRIIKKIEKIPGWCPFKPQPENPYPPLPKGYAVVSSYSNDEQVFVGAFDFSLIGTESPRTMTYDGKRYEMGMLTVIPDLMSGAICSARYYHPVTGYDD